MQFFRRTPKCGLFKRDYFLHNLNNLCQILIFNFVVVTLLTQHSKCFGELKSAVGCRVFRFFLSSLHKESNETATQLSIYLYPQNFHQSYVLYRNGFFFINLILFLVTNIHITPFQQSVQYKFSGDISNVPPTIPAKQ